MGDVITVVRLLLEELQSKGTSQGGVLLRLSSSKSSRKTRLKATLSALDSAGGGRLYPAVENKCWGMANMTGKDY